MTFLSKFAYNANDPEELRHEKVAAFLISSSCSLAGIAWTYMYYMVFGLCFVSLLPIAFTVIVTTAIAISHRTKNHYWAVNAQIICIMYITALIQWNIGGVFDSGYVLAWALCGPITALTFFSLRRSTFWFAAFLLNIVITVYFDDQFSREKLAVDEQTQRLFYLMNTSISSVAIFIFARYFVWNTMNERERANKLLLNILPTEIAKELKTNNGSIAQRHEQVCVMFADIVGFTEYSGKVSPEELVSKLDMMFKRFDNLLSKYQVEKIKTIGDAYMVAGGIAVSTGNCGERMGMMALEMHEIVSSTPKTEDSVFSIRIGIHCGPVIAGVIGHSKFAYDLWGDTVNVASRLESSCEEGMIQVSESLKEQLEGVFEFRKRGEVSLKGKGVMETWYLVGRLN